MVAGRPLLLRGFDVEHGRGSGHAERLAFLANGDVSVSLRSPLTFIVGENGSGKTTLLEAVAAKLGIRPQGGGSYSEWEDEREGTSLSDAVTVSFAGSRPPPGLFIRADKLAQAIASAPRARMPGTEEWRRADEQSRGEGVLSLVSAQMEASERKIYLLDEPETGLSPSRTMSLLCLLDDIVRDGRSQALVATHSTILMSHPAADILWIDENGVERRALEEVDHWRVMKRFMLNPSATFARLFGEGSEIQP